MRMRSLASRGPFLAVFLLSTAVSGAYYDPPGWTTGHTEYEVILLDVEGPARIVSLKGLAIYREEFLGGLLDRERPLGSVRGEWVWAVAAGDPNPGLDPAVAPTGRVWFVYEPSGHVWTVGEFRYRPDAPPEASPPPPASDRAEKARNAAGPTVRDPETPAEPTAPPREPALYAYGVAVGPLHTALGREPDETEPRGFLANLLEDLGNGGFRTGRAGAYNFFVNVDLERVGLLGQPNPQVDLYVDGTPEAWRQPRIPPSP